jgi:hypothetical protein
MYVCMDGCMYVCMYGWVYVCMDVWMDIDTYGHMYVPSLAAATLALAPRARVDAKTASNTLRTFPLIPSKNAIIILPFFSVLISLCISPFRVMVIMVEGDDDDDDDSEILFCRHEEDVRATGFIYATQVLVVNVVIITIIVPTIVTM